VSLANHSPKHSSGQSSKFNLDTPPAKKKMAEKKKERTKTEAKDEKKKYKRIENKRSKETESDKNQTSLLNYFSPPPKKEKKLQEIPCEFSPVKKPILKVMKQAIDIKSPPTWDSPMSVVKKTSTETWDDSQDEESPELVGIVETSRAVNLARSPVKQSTPIRRHAKEEDVEICRLFPDPSKYVHLVTHNNC
jgi:hypothetical protein